MKSVDIHVTKYTSVSSFLKYVRYDLRLYSFEATSVSFTTLKHGGGLVVFEGYKTCAFDDFEGKDSLDAFLESNTINNRGLREGAINKMLDIGHEKLHRGKGK